MIPQAFAERRRDEHPVGERLLERPALREDLRGRLAPHSGEAGDSVGCVASQREQIAETVGCDAEASPNLVRSEQDDLAVLAPHLANAWPDQLQQVLVVAHDDDRAPSLDQGLGPTGDQVVRLESRMPLRLEAKGRACLVDQRPLSLERWIALASVRLVLRPDPRPPTRSRVEARHDPA